jgi:hypothetical protein
MWDHRSTRKPPPPQAQVAPQASHGETEQLKLQAATRNELDARSIPTAGKRHAQGPETEGVGGSSKRWCGAGERSEEGTGPDDAGLNGHEESSKRLREATNTAALEPGSEPQLDVPDSELLAYR